MGHELDGVVLTVSAIFSADPNQTRHRDRVDSWLLGRCGFRPRPWGSLEQFGDPFFDPVGQDLDVRNALPITGDSEVELARIGKDRNSDSYPSCEGDVRVRG